MILHMHNIWLLEKSIQMLQLELSILMLILTRPDEPPTSGTMFREILDNDENVDYLVLGLAQGGNTRALYDYAKTIILFMSMRTNFTSSVTDY